MGVKCMICGKWISCSDFDEFDGLCKDCHDSMKEVKE